AATICTSEHCIDGRECLRSGRNPRILNPESFLTMQQHGPWQILRSHEIYRDGWLEVRKDDVIRPDGLPGTHGVVRLKPGVSVLALDDENRVYLTDEFHYGVGRHTIEVVSGGREPDEAPLEAARR